LDADQPGGFGTIPLPQLDAGPYLSYGLQWLAFGIMAPLGLGYFLWAELRERRKAKSETEHPVEDDTKAQPAPSHTPSDKLADRYGRSR
ncbi:hypothetical protein Q8814_24520, partial [Rhodococcus sp. CC-R104]|nr:hypothetical protein [Rhodococcus sp. CC-R104]